MTKNIIFGFLTFISTVSISYAQLNADEVEKLKWLAKDNEERAIKAEVLAERNLKIAEETRKEVEGQRYLRLVDELAIRSTEVLDKELAARLALQAFNFNAKHKGYDYNTNIYHGLSLALKNYGLLPINFKDSVQNEIPFDNGKTLHEVNNPRIQNVFSKYNFNIEKVFFSNSKRFIATTSTDNIIRVWNLHNINQRPIQIIESGTVLSLFFANNDSKIVFKLSDSKSNNTGYLVHAWPFNLTKKAAELCSHLTRNMTKEEWDYFIDDGRYESTCPNIPSNNR